MNWHVKMLRRLIMMTLTNTKNNLHRYFYSMLISESYYVVTVKLLQTVMQKSTV